MIVQRTFTTDPAKPFACPTCSKAFRLQMAVEDHFKAVHVAPAKERHVVKFIPLPPEAPTCEQCGHKATSVETRYGIRHSCCGQWSWNGKPLADAETHEARIAAHDAFDPIWRSKRMRRGDAYIALRNFMNLTEEQCHMSVMDAETARRVPAAVQKILKLIEVTP